MLRQLIRYIIEMMGVGGLVWLIAYIQVDLCRFRRNLEYRRRLFPQIRGLNRPQKDAGEGSATFGNISVVVRGGARFAVVVAGILLIVGGILKGVQSAAGEKAKESLAEQQKQRLRLDTLQTYVDGLKQAKLVPDEKQLAEMERLLGECCKSSEQQIKRLEPIATGSSPQPSMQPSNVIETHEHAGEFKEP